MAPVLYEVVVIGGGPVGLATAYEVAKAGKLVIVLEQNNFFNNAGSSNDLARMYRTMYTEDFMADLAKQSLDIWSELEKDGGISLRSMSGLLNFGDPKMGEGTPEGSLEGPIKNLERLKMAYQILTPEEIEKKWPFKNLPKNWEGVFAPDNGVINVQLLLRTLLRLAKDYGAYARQHITVEAMTPSEVEGQQVWTVQGKDSHGLDVKFQSRKIIITAGAYSNDVLEKSFGLRLDLDIWEMAASYFNVNAGPNGTVFPSMWFQFAPDKVGPDGVQRSQLFYGFPTLEWGPPNIARISLDAATNRIKDPRERRTNVISSEDLADTQEFIKNHVDGVDSTVPAFACTCLQTNVYDNMFVLDYIPKEYLRGGCKDSVMIFTAGWAMKFVPLLGRALMQMALEGGSDYKLSQFSITRKDVIDYKPRSIIVESTEEEGVKTSSFTMKGQARGSSVHQRHVETPLAA